MEDSDEEANENELHENNMSSSSQVLEQSNDINASR